MPPVMGAVAFLMAEIVGVTYLQVLVAAIIPALLYYGAVYFAVDSQAIKRQLKGDKKENLPPVFKTLISGIQYLFPLIWLVVRLFMGLSPSRAALESILCMLIIALITRNPKYPISLKCIMDALVSSINSLAPVALACASAGLVIGVITLTGIGGKFTSLVMALGQGSHFLALFLTMIVTIILGMGMSISPTYLLAASLCAPGLINVGLSPMAAHLFIVYYSAMATMTPPVALAAYTAAGIAEADPMKVGFEAVKIGIVAFIIPYVFVFRPELILEGDNYLHIALSVIFTTIGVVALTTGVNNWLFRENKRWEQFALLLSSVMLFIPYYPVNIAGAVVLLYIAIEQLRSLKKSSIQSLDETNSANPQNYSVAEN